MKLCSLFYKLHTAIIHDSIYRNLTLNVSKLNTTFFLYICLSVYVFGPNWDFHCLSNRYCVPPPFPLFHKHLTVEMFLKPAIPYHYHYKCLSSDSYLSFELLHSFYWIAIPSVWLKSSHKLPKLGSLKTQQLFLKENLIFKICLQKPMLLMHASYSSSHSLMRPPVFQPASLPSTGTHPVFVVTLCSLVTPGSFKTVCF